MGAYLNKPITEKESETGGNGLLKYGATCMQGWRVNQEDAHNCIVDFDTGCSLFAVYDGHGGAEVAQYTAEHFPAALKANSFWNEGRWGEALIDAFLQFDDHLRSETVLALLKQAAQKKKEENGAQDDLDGSDDDDKRALIEEACMPLEQILEKYGIAVRFAPKNVSISKAKLINNGSHAVGDHHHVDQSEELETQSASEEEKKCKRGRGDSPEQRLGVKRAKCVPSGEPNPIIRRHCFSESHSDPDSTCRPLQPPSKGSPRKRNSKSESEAQEMAKDEEHQLSSSAAMPEIDPVHPPTSGTPETATAVSSDEEDEEEHSIDEDYKEEDDEHQQNDDESEESDEDEEEEEGEGGNMFSTPTGETPGEDSGTTACVALVWDGRLLVANAGDSRCVLSRAGTAVDLSQDHKPDDEAEKARIVAAGGHISPDGRVNGGLNLSRALGDHFYKRNEAISLKEQMISALPDVRIEMLTEKDQFFVVACDGIWNSMTSQQVVDFVLERIEKNIPLQEICEQMCTACLSPTTAGDGTGCDNMTVIIGKFTPRC